MLRRTTLLFALLLLPLTAGILSEPCAAQKKGTHKRTIETGGMTRDFLLHIPSGYNPRQKKLVPMVIMLHGRNGSSEMASSAYYGWKALAKKEKFIVVFPSGIGKPVQWHQGTGAAATKDSLFLSDTIDLMLKELKVDPNKVYMTGHSSGAFMAYSFAATHSHKIAAIGPVAGLVIGKTKPKFPVSVISFHGMVDQIVPYGKEGSWGIPTATESAALFAKHGDCSEHKREDLNKGLVHLDTWTMKKGNTEVQLYSLEKGGHGWPQPGSKSLKTTQLIWEFFKAHPREPAKKKS